MTRWRRFLFALMLAGLGAAWSGAARAQEVLEYDILRDGSVIGEQLVTIQAGGETVEVSQTIEVKALFVVLYNRYHERRETWADGQIVAVEAETDDDGDLYDLTIVAEDGGYIRTVNGETRAFGDDYGFAPDWNLAAADSQKALSAQTDEIYDPLYLERLGEEEVTLPSGRYETERWQASGDFERDLWYDDDGYLVRMLFQSRGSEIEYRRR